MGKTIQEKDEIKTIIYTRVSSSSQKDDLKNQKYFLKQYSNAKGITVDEILEDNRKWIKLQP